MMMGEEKDILIKFGQYKELNITAEKLFEKDPLYCIWLTKQKYFRNNHKNLMRYLDKKVVECSSSFEDKRENIKYKCYNFYVLFFIGQPFVKIGYTEQSIVKRIYNYYFDSNYTALKIDFEKSLIYHTNYSKIESHILNELDRFRLNKQEEKLSLEALPYIDIQMKVIENEDGFCVQKIPMQKVIPFKNNHVWRDLFYVKKTDYKNFDARYIECLKSNNLFDQYNLCQFVNRFN